MSGCAAYMATANLSLMAHINQVIENPVSGEQITFRQTSAATAGKLLAFELVLAPKGHVPASHVHPLQEERFTILEGRMRFRKGLRRIVATPGDSVVVPPGTIHRFENAGESSVRVAVHVRPALRMEDLLETTADLARDGRVLSNGMPKPLDLALFMQEFDQEIAVPIFPRWAVRMMLAPLAWLARRLGLGARYGASRQKAA